MDERVNNVTTQLSAAADDATASFGGLTADQLNWKPSEKGWSVGQCLEHIIKTNTEFYGDFDKIAAGKRNNSFWENWSPLTGMIGGFLIKTLANDAKKTMAASPLPIRQAALTSGLESQAFCVRSLQGLITSAVSSVAPARNVW